MNRRQIPWLVLLLGCRGAAEAPAQGSPPASAALGVAEPAAAPPASASASAARAAPAPPAPWDYEHARRSRVHLDAMGSIGDKPMRDLKLREVRRTDWPALAPPRPTRLPPGSTGKMRENLDGAPRRSSTESGGKLVLLYGVKHVVVADAATGILDGIVDLDAPGVPIANEDLEADNYGEGAYADGIVFLCRHASGAPRQTHPHVEAIELATGAIRWRSPPQACDGSNMAATGEYVVAMNRGVVKLLRRWDGALLQSIPVQGAVGDVQIEVGQVVVESMKYEYRYELR